MEISFYLSILAILISCISLIWSIYVGYRDRGNIKATSEISYIEITSYSEKPSKIIPNLKIKAVNCGRRPVILSMLGSIYSDGSWGGSYIEKEVGRLAENEKYEKTFSTGDSDIMSPDGEEVVDFWFEDTLGRRYKVKNAKENLKKLWGKN
jgi:hypothetical protein